MLTPEQRASWERDGIILVRGLDQSLEHFGFVPPNVDWMPVRRRAATLAKLA